MSNLDRARAHLNQGLFDSSDSSEDEESKGDDGSLESEDENDRKSASSSFENEDSDNDDNNNDTPLTALKPSLEKGDKVWAGWWDLSKKKGMNKTGAPWYEGTVHAVKEVARYGDSRASDYGPIRLYDIHYADGDKLKRVLDVFVCPKRDYELTSKIKSKHWKGVRNRVDKNSTDQYAREIGWYEVSSIDGPEKNYATLYEAMKQSDRRTIKRMGEGDVRKSDLNLPDETLPKKKKKKKKRERSKNDDDDHQPSKKKKSNKKRKKIDFNEIFDDTGSDSDENMEDSHESADGSLIRDDEKKYIGVSEASNSSSSYRARFYNDGTKTGAGTYVLKADAAHAHDECCRFLNASSTKLNFKSNEEYYAARAKEIKERGLSLQDAGTLAEVAAKLQDKKEKWDKSRGNNADEESDDESLASDDEEEEEEEEESNLNSKLNGDEGQVNYMGSYFIKAKGKYRGVVKHNKKTKAVGEYILAVDAAFARDEFCRAMQITNRGFNFSSTDKYKDARIKEINRRGLSSQNVPTLAEVSTTIEEKRNKWEESSPKNNDSDDSSQSSSNVADEESDDEPLASDDEEEEEEEEESNLNSKLSVDEGQVNYMGSSFQKSSGKYRGVVWHNKKSKAVGEYILAVDAAFARDEFCRAMHIADKGFNFSSTDKYKDARIKEIRTRGLSSQDVPTLSEVSATIEEKINHWEKSSPKNDDSDDSSQSSDDLPMITMKRKNSRPISPYREEEATKKTSSNYHGVRHNQRREKSWSTWILYNGKENSVGVYDLESDAARVYDVVATILNSNNDPNFETEAAHAQARRQEAEKLGLSLESIDSVEASLEKAQTYVGNILAGSDNGVGSVSRKKRAPSVFTPVLTERKKRNVATPPSHIRYSPKKTISDLNDDMMEKWGRRLPATDNPFLDSYQNSLVEMLGGSGGQPSNDTMTISTSTEQPAHIEEEDKNELDSGDKTKSSEQQILNYKGVSKSHRKNFYKSRIGYNGAVKDLGSYSVGVDAAHARDEFCRTFGIKNRGFNFNTRQEYLDARAKEIDVRGHFSPPDLETVTTAIQAKIANANCGASSQDNESTEPPQNIHAVTETEPNVIDVDEKEKPEEQQQELASANDNRAVPSTEEEAIPNNSAEDEVKYFGVGKVKVNQRTRFRGQLHYNGKSRSTGDFVLRADAAHSVDIYCRAFNIIKPVNFNTQEEYELARQKEIQSRGLTMDAADTLAKKKEVSSLALVAARLQAKKLGWEKVSKEKNLETDKAPQNNEPSKEQPQAKSHDDDSDDESLFSDTKEEQEELLLSQDSAAPTVAASNMKAAATPKLSEMNLVSVTKEQEESLEFPVGCSVLWKLQDETFERGVVSKAWLDMNPPINFVYEVEPLNGESKQMKAATELAFDTHCPVYIKSLSTDNASLREGEVLLSRTDNTTKTCYTILVKAEANEFQLIHDVPASQLKYRKIEKENTSPPSLSRRASNNSESKDQDLQEEEKSQSTKEDEPEKLKTPDRDMNDRCDMSISTSNSTISTRPSLSTPRGGRGDNVIRWNEQSIDIQLPSWFASDNAVKDHLRCKFIIYFCRSYYIRFIHDVMLTSILQLLQQTTSQAVHAVEKQSSPKSMTRRIAH
jgi:hypothetical protein